MERDSDGHWLRSSSCVPAHFLLASPRTGGGGGGGGGGREEMRKVRGEGVKMERLTSGGSRVFTSEAATGE